MKLTVLFSSLASYTVAFFRHLAKDHGLRIQLVYQPPKRDAPYKAFDLTFCEEIIEDTSFNRTQLLSRVFRFSPDCVLMCSWNFAHFMRISRKLRREHVYVVSTMDNQWHGTARQWIGVLFSRIFLKPCIDTFLVAGDRQAQFAKRLGYPDVMYGYYSADVARFLVPSLDTTPRRGFLYVGRLVEQKGFDLLLAAYQFYRQRVREPWTLTIAGTGPLKNRVHGIPGIDYRGFLQPDELPKLMQKAAAFVLPSRFEPWGVVIHEAAASGLPIICTTSCGASTYFVRDGINGFIVPGEIESLTSALERLSALALPRLAEMRSKSVQLASLWSPELLANYFVDSLAIRRQ
jgi:glycosyltransferase involved in cell wall biosynthesis